MPQSGVTIRSCVGWTSTTSTDWGSAYDGRSGQKRPTALPCNNGAHGIHCCE